MYKQYSVAEMRKALSLPVGYAIEGFLAFGAYNNGKFESYIQDAFNSLGIQPEAEKIEHLFFENVNCYLIGNKRFWFGHYYGGATLSEHCHIACVCGSKKNILIGSCGGLQPGEKSESILIPEYSYGLESSALMYSGSETEHLSDIELSLRLANAINGFGYRPLRYPVVTCQGMLGETWEHVLDWSNKGFGGVEMESGTLLAVSKHFSVPAAAMLRIADNLIEQETVFDESYKSEDRKKLKDSTRKVMFQEAIRELIQK